MEQQTVEKKRRGRPPNPNSKRASGGGNLTFRIRGGMRERLQAFASTAGTSLSEEVERRINASFEREDLEAMLRRVVHER